MIVERIKAICERTYPINLGDVPGIEKDCRIKVARQKMLRTVLATQINEQITKKMVELKDQDSETITREINNILDGYQ